MIELWVVVSHLVDKSFLDYERSIASFVRGFWQDFAWISLEFHEDC